MTFGMFQYVPSTFGDTKPTKRKRTMYREDIVESPYALMILRGLNLKRYTVGGVPGKLLPGTFRAPMYEGTVPDKVIRQRRAKGKLARNARKRQRRNR